MLTELVPMVIDKDILFVGAVVIAILGTLGRLLLNDLVKLIVKRVTAKSEVLLEVEGYNGRKGRVEIKLRATKWVWWQFWSLFERRRGSLVRNVAEVCFSRYGLWHRLLGICRRYTEKCKCPIPYVAVPDWAVAFKGADNSKLWIRDDVTFMRCQVNCESCNGRVFISRPDVVSMAMALDA